MIGAKGTNATPTVTVSLLILHTDVRLEVTTYWVVTVGDATGLLQLVQLNELNGDPPGSTDQVN